MFTHTAVSWTAREWCVVPGFSLMTFWYRAPGSVISVKKNQLQYLPVWAKLHPVCNSLQRRTECLQANLILFRKGQSFYTSQSSGPLLIFLFMSYYQIYSTSISLLLYPLHKRGKCIKDPARFQDWYIPDRKRPLHVYNFIGFSQFHI